jgi:phosphoribosylaminoimidazolecarboxamide formyltransferase/IMP cyclohydrolase
VSGNRFVEAIIAPSFEADAFALLTTKPKWGKSVRLLSCGDFGPASRDEGQLELRRLVGGFLLQDRDLTGAAGDDCKLATTKAPSAEQLDALLFAERIAKHVKSNAIVLARGTTVVGVGAGQMSRVDAVAIAIQKAGARARGSVLASDAFFPFPDGPRTALEAGVTALLEPGGSVRDDDVVATCDELGGALVFTGRRHFRH